MIETNEILLHSKFIDGSFAGSLDFFVDTLLHEGLHFRVVEVIGYDNYVNRELKDIFTFHDGKSYFDERGEIHDWIYKQGKMAGEYSILGSRIAPKPDITKATIRARFINDKKNL